MISDDSGAFRRLRPPPGGIERFAQRLEGRDASPRRPIGRLVIAGMAAAALAVVAIGLLRLPGGIDSIDSIATTDRTDSATAQMASVVQAHQFDRLLGRTMERSDFSVAIDDEPVTVSQISTMNSRIRIYTIESD